MCLRSREATPRPGVFSPDEAAHDWEMISDGELTTEELGRLNANLAAAGLDPDSMADLANGKVVSALPAGALDYLERLYAHAGADGIMTLQRALEEDGSAAAMTARAGLSAGLLTVSHEHVRDADDQRGGWDRLPQDVRDMVTARPDSPALNSFRVPQTLPEFLGSLPADIRADLESDPGAAARTHRNALASPADARTSTPSSVAASSGTS